MITIKAEKRSGAYRVQKMVKGIRYSFTFDHKPTQTDVRDALLARIQEDPRVKPSNSYTFKEAVAQYIEYKKTRLSPKTAKELDKLTNYVTEDFAKKKLCDIKQRDVDRQIIEWTRKKLSYKTMSNRLGSINSISKKFNDGVVFSRDLLPEKPDAQVVEESIYIPTKEDTKKILEYVKKNEPEYYAALGLATYGLRRGEVLALTPDDIDKDNVVHITKALTDSKDDGWIVKTPKESASIRDVPISPSLADYIRKQGYVYHNTISGLLKALKRSQKALGIQEFSLHKFRHFFVTELWQANVPIPDIKRLGGYAKNSDVMEIIYTHSRIHQDVQRRKEVMDAFGASIF